VQSHWDRVKSPDASQIVPYADISKSADISALNKLAVLKVNGGLGTSMGMLSVPQTDKFSVLMTL
jgi:UTP--glucose-1-phosphate uridylyltransferase